MHGSYSGYQGYNNQTGQQASDVLSTFQVGRLEGSQSFTSPNDMSSGNDHGRPMDKPDISSQAGQGQGQQEPSDEICKEKEADIEVRNTENVFSLLLKGLSHY